MEKRAGVEVGRKIRREEADSDHGHRQAERIIAEMRSALDMSEQEILAARKGDWRKRVIAAAGAPGDERELMLAGGAIGNGERRPRQPSQPQPGRFGGACGPAELSRSTSKSKKKGLTRLTDSIPSSHTPLPRLARTAPILLVSKNRLPTIAPRHDVVNRSGKFDPNTPRHPQSVKFCAICQDLHTDPIPSPSNRP